MKIDHDERIRRANSTMFSILQRTDGAGHTDVAERAREVFRAELKRIPEDATEVQVLELREAALNNYTRATTPNKGRSRA